ncbi:hypothetical protein ILYODFUR_038238 [Ilyodon furcidens]|uniref:Uncharacterized protein n=1 Tax=Ilyodon furcidens TaxID=33524 RepID=A0ABV0UZJ3_9TELE
MFDIFLLQIWKNETVAEQEKRSPRERPILLSRDIESKLVLLEREMNYLLNKAKFAKPKPKPKAKNETSPNAGNNANATAEEKIIPSTDESENPKTESLEEQKLGESPPNEENTQQTSSDTQSQPTEETISKGQKILKLQPQILNELKRSRCGFRAGTKRREQRRKFKPSLPSILMGNMRLLEKQVG